MKRKILTILGTRPEIIRLSRIIPQLDALADHRVLHTGQNYDPQLSDVFFQELGLRRPDHVLESRGSLAEQLSATFIGVEQYIREFQPDRVLVLGDTNSGLSAIICERLDIPVYHMEAGNRCYDLRVPEEKNRRLIDSISTVNLPYTELSRQNLLREGVPNDRIAVTGNPIKEVLSHYRRQITASNVLETLDIEPGRYIIATAHRAENVDDDERLNNIMRALGEISQEIPVIFSCHPRTRERMRRSPRDLGHGDLHICEPFGFFDFVQLEQNSRMAISDSGTVQEEMCLFGIPTITIRDSTERPETVWCGSNIVSGIQARDIVDAYRIMLEPRTWRIPQEYDREDVSATVINILMGK